MHTTTRLGVAVAAAIFLGACSSPTPSMNRDAVQTLSDDMAHDFVLPIDAFTPNVPQRSQISRARAILVGECMRRLGFTFDARAASEQDDRSAKNDVLDLGINGNRRRYGVTDSSSAARYGYHLPSVVAGTGKTVTNDNPHGLGPMTPEKRAALNGSTASGSASGQRGLPAGGCVGWATSQIWPSGESAPAAIISDIDRDSYERSFDDVEVSAAIKKWSTCMKLKGYQYPTPREAGINVYAETEQPSQREIVAAQADVTCKREAKLVEIWHRFEIAFQEARIKENFEQLKKVKSDNEALMRRVAAVLG